MGKYKIIRLNREQGSNYWEDEAKQDEGGWNNPLIKGQTPQTKTTTVSACQRTEEREERSWRRIT